MNSDNRLDRRSGRILRPAGESLSSAAARWDHGTAIPVIDEMCIQFSRASQPHSAVLAPLPQAQSQLNNVIDIASDRLRRNSDRMEQTVNESSTLGRDIMRSRLAALGFSNILLPSTRRAGLQAGVLLDTGRHTSSVRPLDAERIAAVVRQADNAIKVLGTHVLEEARRCALLREEVAGQINLSLDWHQQWICFFRSALEATQGQQRHEVQQVLDLLQARRDEMASQCFVARERTRLAIEQEQSSHRMRIDARQADLADYVERRRCDTETEMAARQMSLNERAELHDFDIGKSKLDIERRRNDQVFISSLVGEGLQALKVALPFI